MSSNSGPIPQKEEQEEVIVQEEVVQVDPESQVVVHCTSYAPNMDIMIRVWKSIFLEAKDIKHTSHLVHHENITLAPQWTPVKKGTQHHFTLIFTGLPRGCKMFDIVEKIPQAGAFVKRNIPRNKKDVYRVAFDG